MTAPQASQQVPDELYEGVRFAIKALRDLQDDPFGHLSKWSHSRDLKLAPVELSDYILIQYKKQRSDDDTASAG